MLSQAWFFGFIDQFKQRPAKSDHQVTAQSIVSMHQYSAVLSLDTVHAWRLRHARYRQACASQATPQPACH